MCFLWDFLRIVPSMGFSGTPKDMGPPYGKLPILFPNPTPIFESLKILWVLWYGFRLAFSAVPGVLGFLWEWDSSP